MAAPGGDSLQMATTKRLHVISNLYSLTTGELPLAIRSANVAIFCDATNSQCVTITKHNSPEATVFGHKCELLSLSRKRRTPGAVMYGPDSTFITLVQNESMDIFRLYVPNMIDGLLDPNEYVEVKIPKDITYKSDHRTIVFRATPFGLIAVDEVDQHHGPTSSHELQVFFMNLQRTNWCPSHYNHLAMIMAEFGKLRLLTNLPHAQLDGLISTLLSRVNPDRSSDALLGLINSYSETEVIRGTHLYVSLTTSMKTGATRAHIRDAIFKTRDMKYHFHYSDSNVIPRTVSEFDTYVETQFGGVVRVITAADYVKATLQGFQSPEDAQSFGEEVYYHFKYDCAAEDRDGELFFRGHRVTKLVGVIMPMVKELRSDFLKRKNFDSSTDCPWAILVRQACDALTSAAEVVREKAAAATASAPRAPASIPLVSVTERPSEADISIRGIDISTPIHEVKTLRYVRPEEKRHVTQTSEPPANDTIVVEIPIPRNESLSPVAAKKKVGAIATAYSTFFGTDTPRFETTSFVVPACAVRVRGSAASYHESGRLNGITCLYSKPRVAVSAVQGQSEQAIVGSFAVRISGFRGTAEPVGPRFFGLDCSLDSQQDDVHGAYYVINLSLDEGAPRGSTPNAQKRGGGAAVLRTPTRSEEPPKVVVSMLTHGGRPKPPVGIIAGMEKIDQKHHVSKVHQITVSHNGADDEHVAMIQLLAVAFVRRLSGDVNGDTVIDVDDSDTSFMANF